VRNPITAVLGTGLLASMLVTGCTATFENQNERQLAKAEKTLRAGEGEPRAHGPKQKFSGVLDSYVRYALENSPALRAKFEEWRASTHRISPARRLPNPVISYAYFIRRVETRVGPQRHRLGVSQRFPWPTKLTAAADAASLGAASKERVYEAEALAVTRRVVAAYWQLWRVHRMRQVLADQREVLSYMSGTAQARVEIGKATLADLGQIELSRSRLADGLSGLDERERQASAELVAAMGAPPGTKTPVDDAPPPMLEPAEDVDALRDAIAQHPRLESLDLMAGSRGQLARSADADAYPSFNLGLTWIETGGREMPNVPDNGKDPVIVSLSMSVPIWQGAYGDVSDAALAEGAALRAKRASAEQEALAKLEQTLAALRDAIRRARLYRNTLVPQAEAVYGSVLGGYQTGSSSVTAGLLAQRELLELQLALFMVQADHAAAWARLEEIVGRPVRGRKVER